LEAFGLPLLLEDQPATFEPAIGYDSCSSLFQWNPTFQQARPKPYVVYMISKTFEYEGGPVQLSTIKAFEVKVNYYAGQHEQQCIDQNPVSINTIVDQKLKINHKKFYPGTLSIRVYTLMGQFVKDFKYTISENHSQEFDLSALKKSMYLINISRNNRILYSGKIIKQ